MGELRRAAPLADTELAAGVSTEPVVLTLPRPPTRPLSMNQAIGMHWAAYARHMDPWRDEIAWLAKARRKDVQAMAKPVTIQVTIHVSPRSTYDPSNMLPCLKSLVDGLKIGGLFPNDGPTYVTTLEPVMVKHPTRREVEIRITPAASGVART